MADIRTLSPAGHYLSLRLGFASPVAEVNALPPEWINHYVRQRLMLWDPTLRWSLASTGVKRWSDLAGDDPRDFFKQAQTFGLRYGVAISVYDNNPEGQRSFGTFARADREFLDDEIVVLQTYVQDGHSRTEPPRNLTDAEIEALFRVKNGMRLKQIAFDLGVSEGAVKQRLKSAKTKLSAKTSTQAATIAASHGLI